MMKKLSLLLIFLSLISFNASADDMSSAFKDLGKHYFKGSEMERRLEAVYSGLPIELKTTLSYFAPLQQIFVEQRISIVITFP